MNSLFDTNKMKWQFSEKETCKQSQEEVKFIMKIETEKGPLKSINLFVHLLNIICRLWKRDSSSA